MRRGLRIPYLKNHACGRRLMPRGPWSAVWPPTVNLSSHTTLVDRRQPLRNTAFSANLEFRSAASFQRVLVFWYAAQIRVPNALIYGRARAQRRA